MDTDTMDARSVMLKLRLNPKLTFPTPMDILMPIVILLSTSNPQKRKKRLRKPERSVKPKAMLRLIPKLGITDIMDMVDTTDTHTDMVDTMDILMDTDTTDMANR